MLNMVQSKLADSKYKVQTSYSSEMDTYLNEFSTSFPKTLASSFTKIIMQKYGRKMGRRQSQQLNSKTSKSSNLIKSIHGPSVDQQRIENFRPNFTIYDATRNKKMKRHTYNYRFSSSREEHPDITANKKDNSTRHKKSLMTTQITKNPTNKQIFNEKSPPEENKQRLSDQSEFLRPKQCAKKINVQNKLIPINFNSNNDNQKPSLVELIKKYKFENLKTNIVFTPKQEKVGQIVLTAKISPTKKEDRLSPSKKQVKYYKKPLSSYYRKVKKQQIRKQKQEPVSTNTTNKTKQTKYLLKKMNSILSPWGTTGEQHSFIQPHAA